MFVLCVALAVHPPDRNDICCYREKNMDFIYVDGLNTADRASV
jgi:hypothetical protein